MATVLNSLSHNLFGSFVRRPNFILSTRKKLNQNRYLATFKSSYDHINVPYIDTYSMLFPNDTISKADVSKPALIEASTGKTVTYGDLFTQIQTFSAVLAKEYKFNVGDVLAIYAPNSIQYPTAIFSPLRIGGSMTAVNPLYTVDELSYQLKDSSAKILLTCPTRLNIAKESANKVGMDHKNIIVFGNESVDGQVSLGEILENQKNIDIVPNHHYTEEDIKSGNPAYLCYSSGTTGRSKGVETTHDNIVFNCHQVQYVEKFNSSAVMMGSLPFYHIYALMAVVTVGLWQRACIVVHPRFNLTEFLKSIEKYKIQYLHVVPPIVLQMSKDPIVKDYDLSSLRIAICAAAPMGKTLCEEFLQTIGIPVKQTYGMTEMSPLCHYTPTENIVDGSVGVLLPNQEAKLIDSDGKELGYNEKGELCIRGRNVMKGYLNNPKATKETIDNDNWIHTGDMAIKTPDGYLFIVDRLKELIKYNGFQVVPAELEAILISHPQIKDATVIGIPDPSAGELPKAFVVLNPGSILTESEVFDFVASKVSPHKKLRGGVQFIDVIPKSAAGKILRRLLRDGP
ncbi:hypothetical protein HDV02_001744 [Globomyces sp. JEL0801]|nr:hypothetical protein HDV02_001744 [Globomyces sp. JEL0801]